ncbi:MAG: divergent PAP2 family protein [Clostridia bacterium]|nr:divergent PAP2 family protein [Clostridia bacterium]
MGNHVLFVPAFTWLAAQVVKVIINLIVNKKFDISRLFGDGGMPSCHSATVMSLAMMCGFEEGFGSTYFAIAMILAVIVMHDALGVRRETGKQAVSIISIAEVLNDYLKEHDANIKTDKLKVLVGHTPLQVFVGGAFGIAGACLAHFLILPAIGI